MPRPVPTFRKFVGHQKQVDLLLRQLLGAKSRGEPFPTTLFSGPSGVGKTLLAESLAEEYGTRLIESNGHESLEEFASRFTSAKAGDIRYIDEVHRASPRVQELLFEVIDKRRVPNIFEKSDESTDDLPFIEIAPCTVIMATDQPGKLMNALIKRAELHIRLGYYSDREMREITDRLAADFGMLLSPQARGRIATASLGLPRKAKHMLLNLRRQYPDAKHRQLSISDTQKFFRAFEIDAKGLEKMDRDYLRFLKKHGRSSLESLALGLGFDVDYVRRQMEPVLIRAGLISIGSGGRQLTDTGQDWINKICMKQGVSNGHN